MSVACFRLNSSTAFLSSSTAATGVVEIPPLIVNILRQKKKYRNCGHICGWRVSWTGCGVCWSFVFVCWVVDVTRERVSREVDLAIEGQRCVECVGSGVEMGVVSGLDGRGG